MTGIRFVVATAVLVFACAPAAFAKSWRGLVPLHSTRVDVEKLLGAPQAGSRNFYKTTTETVTVAYAETDCAYGWRVPIDTVISLTVTPKEPLKLADLKLVEANYDKRRDVHLENVYYYVDVHEGLNWTVDTSNGTVSAVEYYPDQKDQRLKCALKKKEQAAPAAQPAVTPAPKRNPRRNKKTRPKVSVNHGVSSRETSTTPWPELSARERVIAMEKLAPSYEYTCAMHRDVHEAGFRSATTSIRITADLLKPKKSGPQKLFPFITHSGRLITRASISYVD